MKNFCMLAFAGGMYLPKGITANEITDGRLIQPLVQESSNGALDVNLSLVKGNHFTNAATTFQTRLFDGILPGPTMKLRAGEFLRINYMNDLIEEADTNTAFNEFSHPDVTNLHFHGAHVTSKLPSDDVLLEIQPQESFQYETFFPSFHLGGTFWTHPHVHGSTTLQIGGGAALALIVEDEPGNVPDEVANAEDILIFVQHFDLDVLIDEVQVESRSSLIDIETVEEVGRNFRLVNGQYRPEHEITVGEWHRLRVVFASWDKSPLDLSMETGGVCEMNLLAKDGIYINDYPRPLTLFPIPTAGRADIMVRCNAPGSFVITHYSGDDKEPLMKLISVAPPSGVSPINLGPPTTGFEFPKSSYTTDLQNTAPTPDCSCTTVLDDDQVNGRSYNPDIYVHTIAQGSIVERLLSGVDSHPYHQHVYPVQLISFGSGISDTDAAYFQPGDYHDVVMVESSPEITIRYAATSYDGRVVVHCHRTDHADMGMISAEFVVDSDIGGVCSCSARDNGPGFTLKPTTGPTTAPLVPTTDIVLPTNDPTVRPTPSPSFTVPTTGPTTAPLLPTIDIVLPTNDPTFPPTVSPSFTVPSSAPTTKGFKAMKSDDNCFDDPEFHHKKKNRNNNCDWVGRKPGKRCKKSKHGEKGMSGHADNYCRESCGTCEEVAV